MIHLFDGNNVMIRLLTDTGLHNRDGMNLRMRFNGTNPAHIWVFDGDRHNDRRRALYPKYKERREPLGQNIYAHINLWKQLLEHSYGTKIEVPTWEADDVIATLAKQFAKRGNTVTIHSNDLDYLQLSTDPLITINGIKKVDVPPRWVPLYKACVGDSSDRIDGIPGFGGKTWAAVASELEWLESAIDNVLPHAFETLSLPKRVKNWLSDVENVRAAKNMLDIVRFYTVPEDEINGGIVAGKYNYEAADSILRKYFL